LIANYKNFTLINFITFFKSIFSSENTNSKLYLENISEDNIISKDKSNISNFDQNDDLIFNQKKDKNSHSKSSKSSHSKSSHSHSESTKSSSRSELRTKIRKHSTLVEEYRHNGESSHLVSNDLSKTPSNSSSSSRYEHKASSDKPSPSQM
jgi:hypothetical protein